MKEQNIEKLLPLVKSIAGKYAKLGVPFEDLVQEGLIGVMDAKTKFKQSKGAEFSTYAVYWIKKRIIQALEKEKKNSLSAVELDESTESPQDYRVENRMALSSINLPADIPELEANVLRMFFEEKKTLNEISETLNISREKIRQLKQKALRRLKIGLK